jgi:hypothetical protein
LASAALRWLSFSRRGSVGSWLCIGFGRRGSAVEELMHSRVEGSGIDEHERPL